MQLRDAYRVLEVPPGVSKETAREARNLLVKVWHPDRYQGDEKVRTRAEEKLKQINEAYELLESVGFPKQPGTASPAASSGNATARQHESRGTKPARSAPDGRPYDWTLRQVCSDGACVGGIGDDGTCKLCRMKNSPAAAPESARSSRNAHDDDHINEQQENDDADRKLCPDGSCIGLVGPSGRCKLCGKRPL